MSAVLGVWCGLDELCALIVGVDKRNALMWGLGNTEPRHDGWAESWWGRRVEPSNRQ